MSHLQEELGLRPDRGTGYSPQQSGGRDRINSAGHRGRREFSGKHAPWVPRGEVVVIVVFCLKRTTTNSLQILSNLAYINIISSHLKLSDWYIVVK
jgi:hypothetical protein